MLKAIAALLLAAGCATGGGWAPAGGREAGDYKARVTAKYDCYGIGWGDARCRPFQRPEDRDWVYVRLLFSYDYACPVSDEDMVMVHVDSDWVCKWRHGR